MDEEAGLVGCSEQVQLQHLAAPEATTSEMVEALATTEHRIFSASYLPRRLLYISQAPDTWALSRRGFVPNQRSKVR